MNEFLIGLIGAVAGTVTSIVALLIINSHNRKIMVEQLRIINEEEHKLLEASAKKEVYAEFIKEINDLIFLKQANDEEKYLHIAFLIFKIKLYASGSVVNKIIEIQSYIINEYFPKTENCSYAEIRPYINELYALVNELINVMKEELKAL